MADCIAQVENRANMTSDLPSNESSPLLRSPANDLQSAIPAQPTLSSWRTNHDGRNNEFDSHQSKSSWYMFLLTISMLGLQIVWSVETSSGSPYLLSLGLTKDVLAFVWIAGPLSGVLVQPYVGSKSDHCTSRFGKRRPFIVGGAVATVASLLALAWAKELVGAVMHICGGASTESVKLGTLIFAIIMIYVLDFAINTMQAAIRTFIVDNAPTHQQDTANAWATRLSGVGNILGFMFGFMDLPKVFPFFGNTQFKVLCVVAALVLIHTVAWSCLSIREEVGRPDAVPKDHNKGSVLVHFKEIYHSIRHLPQQIRAVCYVQFFAWIGWFPFLFYITMYLGEIYASPHFAANPNMTDDEIDQVWQEGTRVAMGALFISVITSFIANVILPLLVTSKARYCIRFVYSRSACLALRISEEEESTSRSPTSTRSGRSNLRSQDLPAASRAAYAAISLPSFTLRNAWLLSHLTFALLTWCTFFVSTTTSATVLVALIGIPWAMTLWAPFALIAAEISRRSDAAVGEGESPQAGVVLGIHNVAIAAPQVIATMVSSAIFRALEKPRGSVGDESVAWVLRFGGLCAVVAAWLTTKVREEGASG